MNSLYWAWVYIWEPSKHFKGFVIVTGAKFPPGHINSGNITWTFLRIQSGIFLILLETYSGIYSGSSRMLAYNGKLVSLFHIKRKGNTLREAELVNLLILNVVLMYVRRVLFYVFLIGVSVRSIPGEDVARLSQRSLWLYSHEVWSSGHVIT